MELSEGDSELGKVKERSGLGMRWPVEPRGYRAISGWKPGYAWSAFEGVERWCTTPGD